MVKQTAQAGNSVMKATAAKPMHKEPAAKQAVAEKTAAAEKTAKTEKTTTEKTAATDKTAVNEKTAEKEIGIDVRYDYAAKALCLPDFVTLCMEFDLDLIEPDTKRLLRDVTKKMFDRIDAFRKVLETLLQPDMSVISMQEAERLEHTDTDCIGEILRRLMLLDRQLLLAELHNTDEAYAQFITMCSSEWPSIKQEMAPILAKLAKGWSIKQPVKARHTQYLG